MAFKTVASASRSIVDITDAYSVIFTNESQIISCASNGNPLTGEVGVGGRAFSDIIVYKGNTPLVGVNRVPTTGEFQYVIGTPVNCDAQRTDNDTFYINTVSSDAGTVPITIYLENGTTSVTKYFTWSKSKAGAVADIIPSSQVFKSTDGGVTFTPATITLTPSLQNCNFSKWQHNASGTFVDASGANGVTISNGILTLSKDSTLFTSSVTSISFKLITDDNNVSDIITIVKLFDVQDVAVGVRNLYKSTQSISNATVTKNYGAGYDNACKSTRLQIVSAGNARINNVIDKNGKYSLSFYAKSNTGSNQTITVDMCDKALYNSASNSITLTTSWQLFKFEFFNVDNYSSATYHFIDLALPANADILFSHMMIVEGTRASSWLPAPEDVQGQLDTLNTDVYTPITGALARLTKSEGDITTANNGISARVKYTEIDAYKNKVLKVRYIRDYLNGSTSPTTTNNYWVEIKAMKDNVNLAKNVVPTSNLTLTNGTKITDEVITSGASDYASGGTGLQYVQLDLGSVIEDLDYLQIWHYFADNRIHNGTKVDVSVDGTNWVTLFDSAVSGTYKESASGLLVPINTGHALNTVSSRLDQASLDLASDSITAKVRSNTSYQQDTGMNKWLVKRYPITYTASMIPKFDTILNIVATQTVEVDDILTFTGSTIWGSNIDNYIGVATTYVYVDAGYALGLSVTHTIGANIYLNNVSVYSTGSTVSTGTAVTLNLLKGWNRIDFMWVDQTNSGDKFSYHGSALISTNANIKRMLCYQNTENVSESSLKLTKDQIDLKVNTNGVIASINASTEGGGTLKLSANKIDVAGLATFTALDAVSAQNNAQSYALTVNKASTVNNVTDTYIPFNDNLCGTNGLNPKSSIATLRPLEGKYGGAVAVEDSTTNKVVDGSFEGDGTAWTMSATMAISSLKPYSGSDSLRFYSASATTATATQTITVSPSTTYTLSARLWNNLSAGNFSIDWIEFNATPAQVLDGTNVTSTRGKQAWETVTTTFTTTSTTTSIQVRIVADSSAIGEGFADNIQLEQKSIATSFVDGSRATGNLSYDTLLGNQFTFSFWFKPLVPNNYSATANWVFSNLPYDGQFIFWKRTTEDYYRARINSGVGDTTFTNTEIVQGNWYMITVVSNGTNSKIYLNGVLKNTHNACVTLPSGVGIGSTNGETGNNMFDDVLITSRVLLDADVKAIYDLQQPLYDPAPRLSVPKPSAVTLTIV